MSELSALLSRRREKQKELKTYKSRKSKLQDIKNDVNNDFDSIIANAINYNERSGSNILLGLQGEQLGVRDICYDIDGHKEKSVYNDSKMYDISSNIDSEIRRCTSEIERLEAEIRRLDRMIESAREADE